MPEARSPQAVSADAYEPDNEPAQAKSIAVDGTPQEHTFYPSGDIDWVKFDAVAGKTYVIETFQSGTDEVDTHIGLYDDPSGDEPEPIRENDDKDWFNGDFYSKTRWIADENGVMYVRVAEWYNDIGAYRISVTEMDQPLISFTPVEGADRYKTAIAASKNAFPSGANVAVIATGENFPDALGGSALAGAAGGPILLTPKNSLPADVLTEIKRLQVKDICILGSTSAVSATVENALAATLGSGHVFRIAGTDRYDTANQVAAEAIEILGSDYEGEVFVATGANFPDALGASPLAAVGVTPVVLARPGASTVALPPEVEVAIIVGGENVVSPTIEANLHKQLDTPEGSMVFRIAGNDRYETTALVAEVGYFAGLIWDGVGIATGANFPDALAAGPALATKETVLLLTRPDALPPITALALDCYRDDIEQVHFFGSAAAVSERVRNQVKAVLN
ncbi:MAG: cell wall-binding repeat-containing protein [Coriobacteriia bacterium]|nr:cell wall-binding repeat-containing protein [Coriobacteriia bacterium]